MVEWFNNTCILVIDCFEINMVSGDGPFVDSSRVEVKIVHIE